MKKIVDIVNFHAAYGEQVRLHEYYYSEKDNREHMRGYVPIRSHREAFLDLARAQLPDKENKEKVFMLTGSFGTGKSHLCLMFANYFSLKPTDLEMEEFFKNWAKRDKTGADNVRNWRGDGRYLVAPCEFGEAKPFEDMILSAVQEALEYEGAEEVILKTHFEAAIRIINTWKEREKSGEPVGVFKDFLEYIGGDDPRDSLQELISGLHGNESSSMQLFQDTYEKATTQKMTFRNDSLLAILRDLLSSKEFQKRYKGLVILADEFGYALSENRVKLSVFQDFAEMSKDGISGMQLIFIGTGHRRFESYGADSQMQIDFRVVQDRVTEVSLESEELEQIIAALVSPKTESSEWQNQVLKDNIWQLTQMAGNVKKLRLFDYLSEPEVLDQLVKNIYPVHPLATYCLTKMSQELGSDARSVFSFFREYSESPPEGGYAWYVKNHAITKPNGNLNILTPDLLVDFFKSNVTSSNQTARLEIRDHIRNYLYAVEEAQRFAYREKLSKEVDPFTLKVLNTIFVYKVGDVPVNNQALEFGLNLSKPAEKRALTSEINSLLSNKILFKLPSGEYELRRTTIDNVPDLLSEEKKKIEKEPFNLAEWVTSLANKKWQGWTEAKGHNQETLADRRMLRLFATHQDLTREYKLGDGHSASYWEYLEDRRSREVAWRDRYEGTMVYVICEDDEDIKLAKQVAKTNQIDTIIIGIPTAPIPIRESVINLKTAINFKDSERYTKLDYQEQSILDEILGKENQKTGYFGILINSRNAYISSLNLFWMREGGKTHLSEPTNEYEPADVLANRLYKKRIEFAHEYLNKSHPKSFSGAKDSSLREAIIELISINRPVRIDTNQAQNRGEIRYLQHALANHGVLIQTGDYSSSVAEYAIENKVEKIQEKYPALADLITQLKKIKPGETLVFWETLEKLVRSPYGLGPYALSIFFACAVRYFGDELRLKINNTQPGYSPTDDPEVIIDVATGKYQLCSVERRAINPATIKFINGIYNEFSATHAKAGSQQTLNEAWRAIDDWWKSRTNLERSVGIYPEDSSEYGFADLLSRLSQDNSASQSFLDEILHNYGHTPDIPLTANDTKGILKKLKQDKQVIEASAKKIKASLMQDASSLFQPASETYKDYAEAMYKWYEELHPDQKLLKAEWQTPLSQTILEAIQTMQDIEKTFLEVMPSAVGFSSLRKVDHWTSNQSQRYISLLKEGLNQIDKGLPKLPLPKWKSSKKPKPEYMGITPVDYYGSVELTVSSPGKGIGVRISKNEDPRDVKQFVSVEPRSDKLIEISESCHYLLVAENDQGDYSRVVNLKFTNLDEGYRLISETSPKLDPAEREYRFRNPVDKQSLRVLLIDLLSHLQEDKKLKPKEILEILQELVEKLSSEKKD